MNKPLLLILMTILSLNCYSQITFEKGYYINNSGQKVDCLIKNIDWKNNPTEFEYRLSENDEQKKVGINSVKEFGIHNISKYSRHLVNIDRSSKVFAEMSNIKNPIYKQEQLFLRVLVEGTASLFRYEDGNLKRYFYKMDDSDVKPLIFKIFKTSEGKVAENNAYKQQLWNDLKCQGISMKDIENLYYSKNELVNFFVKYNICKKSNFINFNNSTKKDWFNLSLKSQLNSSSLKIQNSNSNERKADFGNQLAIRFGVEAEFILPYNNNKWAIIIEPTYQQFKSESEIFDIPTPTVPIDTKVKVEYSSIEVPIGIRHYMFLNRYSKLFIDAFIIIDFDSNSIIDFEKLPDLEIVTNNNLAFGFGYKYNNKYSLELRYATSRNLLSTQSSWSSDYESLSLIFGYTMF